MQKNSKLYLEKNRLRGLQETLIKKTSDFLRYVIKVEKTLAGQPNIFNSKVKFIILIKEISRHFEARFFLKAEV